MCQRVEMRKRLSNAVVVGALASWMFMGTPVGVAAAAGPMPVAAPVAARPAPIAVPIAAAARPAPIAVPAAAAARPAPIAVPIAAAMPDIDACVARLDPQLDIGYDRIAARCPDLMRQLESGPWAPWLPRGWKEPGNDLSAGSLKEFRTLVDRESSSHDPLDSPDLRSLQPILTALAGTHNDTGWSRFKSWLRSILERRDQPTDESWFSRMVSHVGISQSVIRLITYVALGAVVVVAGMIVANELRTAGLLSKRRRSTPRKRRADASADTSEGSWDVIEQASLNEKPRLLLELIVRRLTQRGLLPPAGALTVRELTRVASLPEPADQARLAELALAAERVRYGDARASAHGGQKSGLDEPIARGRELLARLETAG